MKNKLVIIIAVTTLLLLFSVCFAANPKVQIDGRIIDFTDENGNKVEAQLINNRTMVPLRKIFEELGCTIEWNQGTKTVRATKEQQTIKLTIGDKRAYATDYFGKNETEIIIDSEPVIVDNRTLVPLRFIGESLGCDVGWDQANQTAIIISYNKIGKMIGSKSRNLYKLGFGFDSIEVSKYYYDEKDSSRNEDITLSLNSNKDNETEEEKVKIKFSGNSEMVTEIKEEGWNDFEYTKLKNGKFLSNNYVFSSMFDSKKNEEFAIDFKTLDLSSDIGCNIEQWTKGVTRLDTTKMDINTYGKVESDWNKFINTFLSGKRNLKVEDFEYNYIDINNITCCRMNSEAFNTLLLLNKICFRYELNYQDLLSDYPTITYNYSEENSPDGVSLMIELELKNEYKERIKYKIVVNQ